MWSIERTFCCVCTHQAGPKCVPGVGGILCHVCPVGTYKTAYDNDPCLPCTNKPSKATYTATGVTSADCPYQCIPGYSMPACKSVVQTLMDDFGGVVGFVVALIGLVAVVLCCVGIITRIRYLKERRQVCLASAYFVVGSCSSAYIPLGVRAWPSENSLCRSRVVFPSEQGSVPHPLPSRLSLASLRVVSVG